MTVRFISTAQAAKLLSLSPDSVIRRIQRGEITAVKCGRIYRVRLDLLGARA